ncbi:MAG: metalloregulator ArsR/SmtB family transcription factor [Nocardioidaceae bacterium]
MTDPPARVAGHQHPLDAPAVRAARERLADVPQAERLAGLLRLLSETTRLRLLLALDTVEEICVGDLALALGISEDAAGYGLRVLRTAGLVTRRKDGRAAYYRLADRFPPALRGRSLDRLVTATWPAGDTEDPGGR